MEHHVFAVWDFMSLLKALQARLCCIGVPWSPAADPQATRFINEIVLAEESDDGQGGFLSHFGRYLRAMSRCGADTNTIDGLVEEMRKGSSVPVALASVGVPGCVERFVRQTFDLIEHGSLWSLTSAFTFGREDLLPGLFQRIVDELNVEAGGGLEGFRYSLRRHIGLDEGEHGPMAVRLVASLCGSDEARWQEAEQAAVTALEARRDLWDAVHATLRRRNDGTCHRQLSDTVVQSSTGRTDSDGEKGTAPGIIPEPYHLPNQSATKIATLSATKPATNLSPQVLVALELNWALLDLNQ